MRLPTAFWWLTYADFKKLDTLPFLASYLMRLEEHVASGMGCLIIGEPGSGKSTKAAYIATVAAQHGHNVRWVTSVDLHEKIANKDFDDDDQVPWRYKFLTTKVLVLDDLTNEYECYRRPGHILQFLTDRIHTGRPTIITCPLRDMDALEKRGIYPDQMLDKLRRHFMLYPSLDRFTFNNSLLGG